MPLGNVGSTGMEAELVDVELADTDSITVLLDEPEEMAEVLSEGVPVGAGLWQKSLSHHSNLPASVGLQLEEIQDSTREPCAGLHRAPGCEILNCWKQSFQQEGRVSFVDGG